MNVVAAFVVANLRRMVNDRSNIFFVVVLPLLITFALGSALGGADDIRVGVVDPQPTSASREVRGAMERVEGVSVTEANDIAELRDRIARRELNAGWVVASSGERRSVTWLAGISGDAASLQTVLRDAVRAAALRGQVRDVVARRTGADVDAVSSALERADSTVVPVRVDSVKVSGDGHDATSILAVLAGGQLTLFIFLTSLFGAGQLLLSRELGIIRRARAAPVTAWEIVAGEALGRFILAIAQAAIIVVGTMVLFQVDWKSPGTVAALSFGMALVGSGAAMVLGTLGRSQQQVAGFAIAGSLVLAALGGSMQPLEFFPDGMRTAAFATPHAWMNDALWGILVDGKGFADVWVNVVVLCAVGVALLAAAAAVMKRRIT